MTKNFEVTSIPLAQRAEETFSQALAAVLLSLQLNSISRRPQKIRPRASKEGRLFRRFDREGKHWVIFGQRDAVLGLKVCNDGFSHDGMQLKAM